MTKDVRIGTRTKEMMKWRKEKCYKDVWQLIRSLRSILRKGKMKEGTGNERGEGRQEN